MPIQEIIHQIQQLEESNMAIKQELRNITHIENHLEKRITATLTMMETPTHGALNTETIDKRIQELAEDLALSGIENPLLIPILDGALPFFTTLYHYLKTNHPTFRFQISTVSASSYIGDKSTGELTIHAAPKEPLGTRNIILIDDVLDTGNTLQTLADEFTKAHGADSITCMVLVDKQQERANFKIERVFIGFVVDKNAFLLGYGLDWNELFRNLPYIAKMGEQKPTADEKMHIGSKKQLNKLLCDNLAQIASLNIQLHALQQQIPYQTWLEETANLYCFFPNTNEENPISLIDQSTSISAPQ